MEAARSAREAVVAWAYSITNGTPEVPSEGPPVPPARLVQRVAGTPDQTWFLQSGRKAAESIEEALAGGGVRLTEVSSLLDFGCGCGRVLRHFQHLPARLHGSDIDARAIEWCASHLRGEFAVNDVTPPLPWASTAFDLVYALSVFTHLPAALQDEWMGELWRVLSPGGHLLFSIHGSAYLDTLTPVERGEFSAGRLVVRPGPPGSNQVAAFHPPQYLGELIGRFFQLVRTWPEGAAGNPRQDLVLVRKSG